MTDETDTRIVTALAEQGADTSSTPSGSTLRLMRELLDENNLQGYARLYNAFAQAHRANLPYVRNCIPAQIRNFLIKCRDAKVLALKSWEANNLGWEDELRDILINPPMFEAQVEMIAEMIKNREK